ncbi:MAG: glycerophosphodiester phosphodiesterase [Anaerolineae bacterium]|nr:glycerophosphodiester phosphodiesterase [Anaerolineae bacterium]
MNRLENLPKPVIFAHRGASAYAPENTLAAFRAAVEQGADAIELDAKLTRDGEVVVFHDATLKRITGIEGRVNQYRLAELRTMDAGSFFSPMFRGEKIPTLGEVFSEVGSSVLINIELTNYTSPGDNLVERVIEVVKRHKNADRLLFSSFDPRNLLRIRRYLPETPVAILALPGIAGFVNRSWFGRWFAPKIVHPFYTDAGFSYIQKQHRLGRRVHTWTVNGREVMQNLFLAGIDGIFTDDPKLAREALSQT